MVSANTVPSIAISPSVPHHIRLRCPKAKVGSSERRRDWIAGHACFGGRRGLRSTATVLRRSPLLGQNQPISAMATGIAPQTTAHGVKIEPMNSTVVASAATNGQIVGLRRAARAMSGSASSTVRQQHLAHVGRAGRRITGAPSGGLPQRLAAATTGMWAKL